MGLATSSHSWPEGGFSATSSGPESLPVTCLGPPAGFPSRAVSCPVSAAHVAVRPIRGWPRRPSMASRTVRVLCFQKFREEAFVRLTL